MEKKLFIQLNGGRKVTGVLRGYDPFMNLVLDEAVEEITPAERHNIGMVVSFVPKALNLCNRVKY
jgi:small nuclear ribonucleoprotein G